MKTGLFECLTGRFLDGNPVDSVPEGYLKTKSIMDHLFRILNTRRGSIQHLADYGIPDFSEIYRSTPEGMRRLQEAIRNTVKKYEPRLKNIQVDASEPEGNNGNIFFVISAEIIEGPEVQFHTILIPNHPPEISNIKIQEVKR
ncbi:MAG: type VI secretion system baseplate subunit TssE [Fibrobacter sp.]|nr:type VI secretion system baseplate subunit TssE [Fibrobacter sp.]